MIFYLNIDDARKSIGWNASGYGDGFRTWKERKEKTVKGDLCNPAKDLPTIKSIFLSRTQGWEIMNSKTYVGWMGLAPFIELGVGLLVWIHHHHGWCVWLKEKMEYVERITGNHIHVLRVVQHGLIIWNL